MKNIWEEVSKHLSLSADMDDYSTSSVLRDFSVYTHALASTNDTVHSFSREGSGDPTVILQEITKRVGIPATRSESDNNITVKFTFPQGFIFVSYKNKTKTPPNTYIEVSALSTSAVFMEDIKKVFSVIAAEKEESDRVFALTAGQKGLGLTSIGKLNDSLIEDNYPKDIVKGYNHICSCLSSSNPCGRLILLQGSPGTGKSFMIKSLVTTVKSTFVVVGSNLIGDLSGPQILPTLLGQFENSDKSITFILEDADAALTRRDKSNVSKLSDILNLGDGLIGELLDIRIIATTNAKIIDLDPAVLRPGRMCQHIKFETLSPKEATNIYTRLVDKSTYDIKSNMTLAEVYRLARKDGWVPNEVVKTHGVYI